MPFVPFHEYFPEIAERETRTIIVQKRFGTGVPPGEYGLVEMYCDERGCDCRRVFFYVVSSLKKDVEAVISYGWESPEFYARWMRDDSPEIVKQLQGPVLNMGSPQSRLAPKILEIVKDIVIQDEAYIERIKSHYAMFRAKIDRMGPRKHKRIKDKRRKRKRNRRAR